MSMMIIMLLIVFGGLIGFNLVKQTMIKYYFEHFQMPAVTVSVVTAKQTDWHPFFSSVGTFIAVNGVDVNTQSGGKVSAIHFDSGQLVEKDSPLIDIDDHVEQATLKFNQANLVLQQTNYRRQTDLLKHNATAASSVDEARALMLQAEANVENTQALIDLKHIKAPFSGVLGIRQIDLGQYVQPGQTNIVSLQSLDPIYLHFYIPEQYINLLQVGQNITFSVEQNPGISFKGKISAINSKIDESTHNIEVEALAANCPALDTKHLKSKLKNSSLSTHEITCDTQVNARNKTQQFNFIPGMFAAINLEQPVMHNVILLPTTAISYTMYGDSVFVVEKHDHDRLTVKRVFVTTGETRGNYTVIKKGLQANQTVVAAGELKLQDGTQVVIDPNSALIDHDNIDLLGE